MLTKFVRIGSRPLAFAQIRLIDPVRYRGAAEAVAGVYDSMEREFGVLAPTVALHACAPDLLNASWSVLREALLVPGLVDRRTKEAVAAAVSVGNTCPYCVTVHNSMVLPAHAEAIAHDRLEEIEDPRLRALATWVRANATRAGAAGLATPFPAVHDAEILAVMMVFQYYNRMVNVFLRDAPLPPGVPAVALRAVAPTLAWLMRTAEATGGATPGESLDLLPAAPPAQDLGWAAGNPIIESAFARADAAFEAAGRRSVPDAVRALVRSELADWDGGSKGLSRAWVESVIEPLAPDQQPAGRLALLVALASYQVDQGAVDQFRNGGVGDQALIELAGWAGWSAARRAGGWISLDPARTE